MLDFGQITPQEAIEYFKEKSLVTPEQFAALSEKAKALAFTVAELSKQKELEFAYGSIKDALQEGMGYEEWKRSTKELWESKGWQDFRLKTIYQTNMHQAKNAGAWQKHELTKDDLPYLRYSAILDSQTRPSHANMHGIVAHVDDPFWDTFYPSNGFGCRCLAYAISEAKAKRLGITPKSRKIGSTDKGFDYNPGKSYDGKLNSLLKEQSKKTEEVKKEVKKMI
jgi:SPP1 gp7 family putative phage head morphogenesis protein